MSKKFIDLFSNPVNARITSLFDYMDICEEEIKRAIKARPDCRAELFDAFQYLKPPEKLREYSREIYRAHCRELLERVAQKQDISMPTWAEIAIEINLINNPLTNDGAGAYSRAVKEMLRYILDKSFKQSLLEIVQRLDEVSTSYPESVDEIIAKFRRQKVSRL